MAKTKTKAKPGSIAELAELYPAITPIDVHLRRVDGVGKDATLHYDVETVFVVPMAIAQLGAVAQALAPAGAAINANANLFVLIAEHPREIVNAVATAIEWDPANVGRIHPSDFVDLVQTIFEANADFFRHLLGPLASGIPARKVQGNGAGETPSASFGGTDAPIPKDSH